MLLQSNPTAVTKVQGSLIIAGWENRALDWATITSATLIREAMASRKYRAEALAYWLGMFYTPPPGKERPGSRQCDQRTPEEETKEQAKAVVPADNAERQRDPAKGKGPWKEKPKPKELWEIGPSGASPEPEPSPEPVAERPRRRRLRCPASRGEEAGTIAVMRFPAQGPPRRTTLRVAPMEGAGRTPQVHYRTTQVATAPVANTTTRAEEVPVVEQIPQVAEVPVVTTEAPAAEETLPGTELLMVQEPAVD
jgi:hypothetical protein